MFANGITVWNDAGDEPNAKNSIIREMSDFDV